MSKTLQIKINDLMEENATLTARCEGLEKQMEFHNIVCVQHQCYRTALEWVSTRGHGSWSDVALSDEVKAILSVVNTALNHSSQKSTPFGDKEEVCECERSKKIKIFPNSSCNNCGKPIEEV